MSRIEPLNPPYEPAVATTLAAMMPAGVPPILLFRTFANNLPMTEAMRAWGSYELGRHFSLSMRDREILIARTCARCGCEYEWGVHTAFFADRVRLSQPQIRSIAIGGPEDACWVDERDALLVKAADALHDSSTIGDELWVCLSVEFDQNQLLDMLMLCGWYHAISFTANASGVPSEVGMPRFADLDVHAE
jgi:alkylhydroperoxidase family enzyme